MSIREKVNEQEQRMIELIKENAQLKRDSLVLEAILAENAELRREIKERRGKPVSAKDWEMKIAETQSKYKGKAIAEGKLKKKVINLETKIKCIEEDLRVAHKELEEEKSKKPVQVKPKLCVVRADYDVFRDLSEAYERIDSLLLENEAYREHCSKVEFDNSELKKTLKEATKTMRNLEISTSSEIATYEELLSESNNQIIQYQEDIESFRRTIQILEGKLQSKEIMYNSYKEKNGASIIVEGVEEDLYPGEQRDVIIGYIKEVMGNLDKNTRQYHICKSLVEANPENGTRAELRRAMFEKLRTIGKIDQTTPAIPEAGLSFYKEGTSTHPKAVFMNNERYTVSIAGTPSDTRSGINTAQQLSKFFL